MAYEYPKRIVTDGDLVDPQDVSENIKAGAGEINGHIDRDNIAGTITHDKVALNAMVALKFWDRDGDGAEGVDGVSLVAGQNVGQWRPVTDLSNLGFDSKGGVHTFRARLEWVSKTVTGTAADIVLTQLGLFVDGELVDATDGDGMAQSGAAGSWGSGCLFAALALEEGPHVVTLATRWLFPAELHYYEASFDIHDGAIGMKEYRA